MKTISSLAESCLYVTKCLLRSVTTASPGGRLISATLEPAALCHWLLAHSPIDCYSWTSALLILGRPSHTYRFHGGQELGGLPIQKKNPAIFLPSIITSAQSSKKPFFPQLRAHPNSLGNIYRTARLGESNIYFFKMPLFVLSETSAGYVLYLCDRDQLP